MYNKLFTKILDSSIWLESKPTRIVWVTFIAVMDEQGFCQFATVENVARRANVTTAEAEKAIATLEGPDPHSSDPDNEGRRLERVPGGWVVRNAEKYRSLVKRHLVQEQTAERVRRHRAKAKKQKTIKPKSEALHGNAPVTPSETESEAGSETEKEGERARTSEPKQSPASDRFGRFWAAYPRKVGKDAALRAWTRLKPNDAMLDAMCAAIAVQAQSQQWREQGGKFIPHPTTWLHQGRWKDELEAADWEPEPTAAELRDARLVRDKAWGGCRHEPRCENSQACLTAIVREQRADRRAS